MQTACYWRRGRSGYGSRSHQKCICCYNSGRESCKAIRTKRIGWMMNQLVFGSVPLEQIFIGLVSLTKVNHRA